MLAVEMSFNVQIPSRSVCAHRHRQEAPQARSFALHIVTDLVGHAFRENACKQGTFMHAIHSRARPILQPIESTMILTGH